MYNAQAHVRFLSSQTALDGAGETGLMQNERLSRLVFVRLHNNEKKLSKQIRKGNTDFECIFNEHQRNF